MYDAMNEPHEFVGESREDAIAQAAYPDKLERQLAA